jgi:tRNA-dihydrouridine synthase
MMGPVLYMAPVRGVTESVYRNVYSRFFKGYDLCVTPFITNSRVKRAKLKDVLPENNDAAFGLVPQILERDPSVFILLAERLYTMGYKTINWNLGCPLSMVRKKKKGSGMLPFTGEIVEFLNQVIPAVPNKVSIKVRSGSENCGDLTRLLPELNGLPLKEIIIHPRTGKQMYSGKADIDFFDRALCLTGHTVVYNGDIDSREKFEILSTRFPGVSRWMIGRGGIMDPFLPGRIKNIEQGSEKKQLERFIAFHEALLEAYRRELSGPGHLTGKMKEMWKYWSPAFEKGRRFFLSLSRTGTIKKYLHAVDKFFSGNPGVRWGRIELV